MRTGLRGWPDGLSGDWPRGPSWEAAAVQRRIPSRQAHPHRQGLVPKKSAHLPCVGNSIVEVASNQVSLTKHRHGRAPIACRRGWAARPGTARGRPGHPRRSARLRGLWARRAEVRMTPGWTRGTSSTSGRSGWSPRRLTGRGGWRGMGRAHSPGNVLRHFS